MDTPMIALWSRRVAVMASRPSPPRPTASEGATTTALVVRRRELDHEVRHAVLHLGEGHRIEDLVADAVVFLAAEAGLAPEVVELDGLRGPGDLLLVEALGLLHGGHEGEGRIGEVDAGGVPLAVLLGVPRLPALDLVRQRVLHVPVDPRALDVRLARDVGDDRPVDL